MTEYKDQDKLSSCCAAPMNSDYDICPECKEHAVCMGERKRQLHISLGYIKEKLNE